MTRTGWLHRRNGRLGRVCKWAAVIGCFLMGASWVTSLFVLVVVETGRESMTLAQGGVTIITFAGAGKVRRDVSCSFGPQISGSVWLPRIRLHYSEAIFCVGELPLWVPLLVSAIPVMLLVYRDRRHPPGHCQRCGYNLTGNVSGVCPECGVAKSSGPVEAS